MRQEGSQGQRGSYKQNKDFGIFEGSWYDLCFKRYCVKGKRDV